LLKKSALVYILPLQASAKKLKHNSFWVFVSYHLWLTNVNHFGRMTYGLLPSLFRIWVGICGTTLVETAVNYRSHVIPNIIIWLLFFTYKDQTKILTQNKFIKLKFVIIDCIMGNSLALFGTLHLKCKIDFSIIL